MAKLKWSLKAFQEIRRSPGVVADLRARTARVAAAAGEGYEGDVVQGKSRARGGVVTATNAAKRDNARNNTLLRALERGR